MQKKLDADKVKMLIGALSVNGSTSSREGKTIEPSDPLLSQAIIRLRNALTAQLQSTRTVHTCGPFVCSPQSEPSLIAKGMLVGPPLTSNVFLCLRGAVHVCTERACEHYGFSNTRTCHVSGFQFGTADSSYDKGDSRTWKLKPETQSANAVIDPRLFLTQSGSLESLTNLKRSRTAEEEEEDLGGGAIDEPPIPTPKRPFTHKRISDEDLSQLVSGMVKLLLYSPNRVARNRDAIKAHQLEGSEAVHTYVRQQVKKKQRPYWTDNYRLMGYYSSRELPLREFAFSQNLHDYYVSIIVQVWRMVMRFYVPTAEKEYDGDVEIPPRLDVGNICLGVLYSMRQGIRYNGHTLLPKDDFLLMNLPIGPDLSYFNIRKRRVSIGEKIITQTYENALAEDAPLGDIAIDVTLLPEKRVEQHVQEEGSVPSIITTNGERLFMPQTRRKK